MSEAINDFREIEAADGEDVHHEAIKRFEDISTRENWSRQQGIEDLVFTDQDGGQWDNFQVFGYNADSKGSISKGDVEEPRYQNDKISPVIEEAVDNQRQASIDIKVRPLAAESKGLADTFNGLIKNIETVSGAQDAYDTAYDEQQRSGYGGWRVVTEYADDSFDQRICIEPIKCATGSLLFGPSRKYTKEDSLYAFYIWSMDLEEYNAQYPDKQISDFPKLRSTLQGSQRGWFDWKNNLVQLAEYWRKRPITRQIAQLIDGRVVDAESLPIVQEINEKILMGAKAQGITLQPAEGSTQDMILVEVPVARTMGGNGEPMIRDVDSYEVERFIMNGREIVKGPQKWAGKYIPLIPCFGVVSNILGQEIVRGRVRKGKDAQRGYNYAYSRAIDASSNAYTGGLLMTTPMVEGANIREQFEKMNVEQQPALFYNFDPDVPQGPQPYGGTTVQPELLNIMQKSEQDIFSSIGGGRTMNDGTALDGRSGEAVKEQRIDQEKGQSVYFNNYIKSREYTGRVLVDLIPRIYSTQQQVRIIKPDGSEDFVTVNQTDIDPASGDEETVVDLSQAYFDVTVDVGPAYASQRQAAQEALTQLATESEVFANNSADLIAKNMDFPGSNEVYERIRKLYIQNGIITNASPEELEELGITREQQIAAQITPQIEQELLNSVNMRVLMANADKLSAEAQNMKAAAGQKEAESRADLLKAIEDIENAKLDGLLKAIEGQEKMINTMAKKIEVFGALNIGDIDNMNTQSDVVEEQQQEVSPGPNSQQSQEFGIPPNS